MTVFASASRVVPQPPILLVLASDGERAAVRHALEGRGHTVVDTAAASDGLRLVHERLPAIVIADARPVDDGSPGVLRAVKETDPDLPVIVVARESGVDDAVEATRDGALNVLGRPLDVDRLAVAVTRAFEQRRLAQERQAAREEIAVRRGAPPLVGVDPSLRKVFASLQRAAATDTTVLIEGESGTGKELFAKSLHALSARADGPFVAINCAALPEHLLESELFGYEKGAFTGAYTRKLGRFELAQHGTLFLDEIGDLPLGLQAKILRALEERRFERLGGTASIQVDVRLVAATNVGLRAAVAARRFREDLYFRLSVFPIAVPPLRDRPADVPLLARFFVERFCRGMKKATLTIADEAMDQLCAYEWPGNVRELQNCIERAVILADTEAIQPRHLNVRSLQDAAGETAPSDPWDAIDLSGSLADATRRVVAEVERRKILDALRTAGQNKARAADLLQISHKVLIAKLRDYQIGE